MAMGDRGRQPALKIEPLWERLQGQIDWYDRKAKTMLNKWQENWILYRATCEGLRNEQHLFAEKAGSYAGLKPDAAHKLLAERSSSLVMAEHGKWSQAHEHKIETTGAF